MLFVNDEQILELISRRERQLLVHSYLYYEMDINLISDYLFDEWAYGLVEYMKRAPKIFEKSPYYHFFKNFDGSTGHDLPYRLPEIQRAAERLASTPNKKEVFK